MNRREMMQSTLFAPLVMAGTSGLAQAALGSAAGAAGFRQETDSLGAVEVPADKLWGAQTQRSLEHFSIGGDLMPREMITTYAILKKAATNVNFEEKRLGELRRAGGGVMRQEIKLTMLSRPSAAEGGEGRGVVAPPRDPRESF